MISEARRAYEARKRQIARQTGMCVHCWFRPAVPGYHSCEKHLEYAKQRQRKKYSGKRIQLAQDFTCLLEKLTEPEKAWLAGLIDGEGCIRIFKSGRQTKFNYKAEVSIANTDKRILEKFKSLLTGAIYENGNAKRKSYYKPCFIWQVSGVRAGKLLECLMPYLISKAEKAELAIELENQKMTRKYRLSQGDSDIRKELCEKMKALNR